MLTASTQPLAQGAVNYAHPLNRGLRAWYKTLPGSPRGRRWSDLCGLSHASLVADAKHAGPLSRQGSWGCIALDGTGDYVDSNARLGVFGTSSITITLWAWHINAFGSGVAEALFQAQDANGEFVFVHYTDANLYAGFNSTAGGNDRVVVASTAITWPQRTWSFYTLTAVDTGTTTLYHNAVSLGTQTGTSAFNPTGTLQFGSYAFLSTHYNGFLDDIRVYNRALSADEVRGVYNESRRVDTPLLNVRRRRILSAAGQQYTQNLSGVLAQAGTLSRLTTKALTGAV